MTKLTQREFQALLRIDFHAFIERSFLELNPATPFEPNWHLEYVASKLAAVMRGEIKRLIIMVPPRSLKSHAASIAFPAFVLGHHPSKQIICASYSSEFAEKLARETKRLMETPFYQRLFPRTLLKGGKQSVAEFETSLGGVRFTTSPGGSLTGRGADIIVIDDALKPDEAMSQTTRVAVNNWWDGTLYSRLNDKKNGAIVIVMQRLHEDDIVGHVLTKGENWDVVRLPAIIYEEEEVITYDTPYGRRRKVRPVGDILHAARESKETLDVIKAQLGEYHFASQYLQSPMPPGGGIIKREWFKFWHSHHSPGFEYIVWSWDTANKGTELSDYSVGTRWGIKDNKAYLMQVVRKRMDYPTLKRTVFACCRYGSDYILIEEKASGEQLIPELRAMGLRNVIAHRPIKDKVMRLSSVSALIEAGAVYLPENEPFHEDYLQELTMFPASKNDDQVDSTSQFLQWYAKINRSFFKQERARIWDR